MDKAKQRLQFFFVIIITFELKLAHREWKRDHKPIIEAIDNILLDLEDD